MRPLLLGCLILILATGCTSTATPTPTYFVPTEEDALAIVQDWARTIDKRGLLNPNGNCFQYMEEFLGWKLWTVEWSASKDRKQELNSKNTPSVVWRGAWTVRAFGFEDDGTSNKNRERRWEWKLTEQGRVLAINSPC